MWYAFNTLRDETGVVRHIEDPASGPCAGPADGASTVQGACGDDILCAYCWERRARLQALRCAAIHLGQCNHARFTIHFHGAVHPHVARDVIDRAARVLDRANFDNRFLALHPFGLNPVDGPRVRLEAVVSGHDANPDVLDPDKRMGLLRAVSGIVDVPVSLELVGNGHTHSRHHVMQLLQWGYEVGCQSLPTRRIIAGQYRTPHGPRVRYTNLDAAMSVPQVRDLPTEAGASMDWNGQQLTDVLAVARDWRLNHPVPSGSRTQPLRQGHQALLARVTPWRSQFRLDFAADDSAKGLR